MNIDKELERLLTEEDLKEQGDIAFDIAWEYKQLEEDNIELKDRIEKLEQYEELSLELQNKVDDLEETNETLEEDVRSLNHIIEDLENE